jgi:hypothetical protein
VVVVALKIYETNPRADDSLTHSRGSLFLSSFSAMTGDVKSSKRLVEC